MIDWVLLALMGGAATAGMDRIRRTKGTTMTSVDKRIVVPGEQGRAESDRRRDLRVQQRRQTGAAAGQEAERAQDELSTVQDKITEHELALIGLREHQGAVQLRKRAALATV